MAPLDDSQFWDRFQVAVDGCAAGSLSFARLTLEELLLSKPDCVDVISLLGIIYAQLGELGRAKECFKQAIQHDPQNPSHYSNYGNVFYDLGQSGEAAVQHRLAIELRPDFAEAFYGLGNAQQKLGQFLDAIQSYDRAITLRPSWAEPLINKGNSCQSLKRADDAMACYARALELQPGHASALLNIGKIFLGLKNYQAALDSFKTALQLNPECYDAYMESADLLIRLLHFKEAQDYCLKATQLAPRHARAYFLMGISFYKLRELTQAISFFEKAISLEPQDATMSVYYNALGACFRNAEEPKKSEESYQQAIKLDPENMVARSNLADLYYSNRALELAHKAFKEIKPDLQPLGLVHFIECLWCDWAAYAESTQRFLDQLPCPRINDYMEDPWHLQRVSDSASLACITATNYKKSIKNYDENLLGALPRRPQKKKIRIGFFSPDFKAHPVAHLLLGVLQKLNREKFELFAFSFGVVSPQDTTRPKLLPLFTQFIDINQMHEADVARKARELEIDIAIDLAGITADNRCALFGYRLAPVQVNFLGYMGTIGDCTEDYIIGDAVTIPADLKKYYYEKVVTLPSFMPYDDTHVMEGVRLTRAEAGLPEGEFIFACFNPGAKITPMVFDSWMRILAAVPHSRLWLSPREEIAVNNLKSEAKKRGIREERIIFAPKIKDVQRHIARQQHIDLFLDTYPYNAHATAADALWAGAPLLTRLGESMSSRVAASLLTAVGLSELITTTPEEYEAMAINLAMHPEKIAALKTKLATNRAMSPLFNTRLYTQYFEAALTAMYERSQAGLPPDDIEIKA